MAVKKEEAKNTNVFGVFWENANVLEKLEQNSLQVLESQKQWLDSTGEHLAQWEEHAKKLTTEWKLVMQDSITKNTKIPIDPNALNWFNHLEEITHKSQSLSFIPAKKSHEFISQSHANFSTLYTDALKQQQKNRLEMLKPFESMLEQWKQAQQSFFKTFELPVK